MKKIVSIILVSCALTHCGPDIPDLVEKIPEPVIDAELQANYDMFIEDMKARHIEFNPLIFGDVRVVHYGALDEPGQKYNGRCDKGGTVRIDASFAWSWILLYHELGHCYLGLPHSDNPEAIMYPVAPVDSDRDRTEMIDEMVATYRMLYGPVFRR